ncbi:MAG: hypothetical protein KDB07_02285 [Planctomycetes bacterium]|nr:hypothetical protein [Planctomycetota bacterium]
MKSCFALLLAFLCLGCQGTQGKTNEPAKTTTDAGHKTMPALIKDGDQAPTNVNAKTAPESNEPKKTEEIKASDDTKISGVEGNPEGATKPDEGSEIGVKNPEGSDPKPNEAEIEPKEVEQQPKEEEKPLLPPPPPPPLEMPEFGSQQWHELVDSTDFESALRLLNAKYDSIDKSKRTLAQTQALVAAHLSLFIADPSRSKDLDRADKLFREIEYVPQLDQQWKRQITAMLAFQGGEISEARKAASKLHDAYLKALENVPFEVVRLYHCLPTKNDRNFFEERMLKDEKRPNEVYTLYDDVRVCLVFEYLKGIYDRTKEKWNYHIAVSARLYEEDLNAPGHHFRRRIATFKGNDREDQFASSYPPDAQNLVALTYRLPVDLKSNTNYILEVTATDKKRDTQKEVRYLTIKVRDQRVD